MKATFLAAFCLVFPLQAVAQDATTPTRTVGKDWIKKFEGSWQTTSRAADGGATYEGRMTSRGLGEHWVVNEFRMDMGGFQFHAQQTLGFDQAKNVFTATWVDNAMDFKWNYDGELNEEKKQLIFVAEGPASTGDGPGTGDGQNARYRDIYEFRGNDLIVTTSQLQGEDGQWNTFMSGEMKRVQPSAETTKPNLAPLLMFKGQAEQAMRFYASVFPDSKIEKIQHYGEDEAGKAGSVKHATLRVAGTKVMCIDSPANHPFDFTPSVSLFVDCANEEQVAAIFAKLSEGGNVLMPLDNYEFSKRFGWVNDQFGVSWQLNFGDLK